MNNNILLIKEYNLHGRLLYSNFPNGEEVWFEYDSDGRVIHARSSKGIELWSEYDSNGNAHIWNSLGYESWYDCKVNRISKEQYDELYGTNA